MALSPGWKKAAPVLAMSAFLLALALVFLWLFRPYRRPTWEEFVARFPPEERETLRILLREGIRVSPDCEVGREDELHAYAQPDCASGCDEHLRLLATLPR